MHLLDSRASRMFPNQALLTLHADNIGQHANYRKWYFVAQLDLDDVGVRQWTTCPSTVATVTMILATLAEFSLHRHTPEQYISPHLSVSFLLVTLALTAGLTFYIAIVENQLGGGGSLALILGIARFFISIGATLLFRILPSSRMFGGWVTSKSCKYLASQTFTASYPILHSQARLGSVFLWLLVFGCKFTESYFFLTFAFRDPIQSRP
jgi:1,3-beta-glucan synthase